MILPEEIKITNGDNISQNADFEVNPKSIEYSTSRNLSCADLISINRGLNLISEFYDVNAACSVKIGGICAAALGQSLADAIQKIMDSNPVDFMSSVIVVSTEVNSEIAKYLKDSNIIVAPKFTQNAIEILNMHNIRYMKVKTPLKDYKNYIPEEIKVTPLGTFIQSPNLSELDKDSFKVVTKQKPTVEQIEDAVFAWKVAKHVNSQAIVIAKDFKAIGIGQGQTSRIDAFEIALNKACDGSKDAVAASDGFFPAIDNIQVAAQGRIAAIIQPGGSIKDDEVIKTADKYNIAMVTTGIRHFKH